MLQPEKILFITAEADPFAKVGGLADVAGTLPRVLRAMGVDIRVVLPMHAQIDRSKYDLKSVAKFSIPSVKGDVPAEAFYTEYHGLPVYLLASPLIPEKGSVYSPDSAVDGPKYVHFSLAALQLARELDWCPDLVHAQDWHTAAALYVIEKSRDTDDFFAHTATLLTVHNLPYHGEGASQALSDFGIAPAVHSALPWWAQHRPLALGLLAADHINTVSPGYAGEMLTEEFGAGLDAFLRKHKQGQVSGILNGLDLEAWNPMTDHALAQSYDRDHLTGKNVNKTALQEEAGLPIAPQIPLFGIVSRMDSQKGIDLAIEGLRLVREKEWQAVILGTGNPEIEAAAVSLADQRPNQVKVWIDFNASLGRRIYAGVDAFLIPSRYEPSGLTQMISMRYGTVPVARAVGGLKDTILDYPVNSKGTGFLFDNPSPFEMAAAIRRAIDVYGDKRRWRGLQNRGMKQDFSWKLSAETYLALYRELIERRTSNSVNRS